MTSTTPKGFYAFVDNISCSEELAVVSGKHRSRPFFYRVARLAACGERYIRHVRLRENWRATSAAFHRLGWKRSHPDNAKMVVGKLAVCVNLCHDSLLDSRRF